MDTGTLLALLAVLIPILGGPFCFLFGKVSPSFRTLWAVLLGFASGICTLLLIPYISEGTVRSFSWAPPYLPSIGISLDSLSVYVALVAGVIGALIVLYSTKYIEPEGKEYSLDKYYWDVLLFIGGMLGLVLTSNILIMYAFWEIIGFCSYSLIAYLYHDPAANYGGTKAFITTRIGDAGFMVGLLSLWLATGSLDIFQIIKAAQAGQIPTLYLTLAGAGFIIAAAAKSAQFPFHVWLPDAMTAPTSVTALIHAACLVNAGVYLLARTYPIFVSLTWWGPTVVWIGAITAFLGATVGLVQWDIKRMLAFSTISQLGYMVAAIGAGALVAGQFHLVSHAILKALLFLCAGAIIEHVGTRDMRLMGGLRKEMPVTYWCCTLGLLSLSGIPIWTGFFSKDLVLDGLLGNSAYLIPLILLVLGALFTAAYSWRLWWLTFQGEKRNTLHVHEAPWQMTLPLAILAIATTVFWLFISPFTAAIERTLTGYPVEVLTLSQLLQTTFFSPIIFVSIAVVILVIIFALTWKAGTLKTFQKTSGISTVFSKAYWIDIFYSNVIVRGYLALCRGIGISQPGDLNFNNFGIIVGFVIIVIVLFFIR